VIRSLVDEIPAKVRKAEDVTTHGRLLELAGTKPTGGWLGETVLGAGTPILPGGPTQTDANRPDVSLHVRDG